MIYLIYRRHPILFFPTPQSIYAPNIANFIVWYGVDGHRHFGKIQFRLGIHQIGIRLAEQFRKQGELADPIKALGNTLKGNILEMGKGKGLEWTLAVCPLAPSLYKQCQWSRQGFC
jgi:hypothetical protein